jgi:hypothetical protein
MKNIELIFKNGEVDMYVTKSTNDLKLPSLEFKCEEDAELAIAIAKAIKARKGHDYLIELHNAVKYVFRTLNLQDSGWT